MIYINKIFVKFIITRMIYIIINLIISFVIILIYLNKNCILSHLIKKGIYLPGKNKLIKKNAKIITKKNYKTKSKILNKQENEIYEKKKEKILKWYNDNLPLKLLIPLKEGKGDHNIFKLTKTKDYIYHLNYIKRIKFHNDIIDSSLILFVDDYAIDKFSNVYRDFEVVNKDPVITLRTDQKNDGPDLYVLNTFVIKQPIPKLMLYYWFNGKCLISVYESTDGINFIKSNILKDHPDLKKSISKPFNVIWEFNRAITYPCSYPYNNDETILKKIDLSKHKNIFPLCGHSISIIYDELACNDNQKYKCVTCSPNQQASIAMSNDLIHWIPCLDDTNFKTVLPLNIIIDIFKNYDFNINFNKYHDFINTIDPLKRNSVGDTDIQIIKNINKKNSYFVYTRRWYDTYFINGGPKRALRIIRNDDFNNSPTNGWKYEEELELDSISRNSFQIYRIHSTLINNIYYGLMGLYKDNSTLFPYITPSRDGIYYDIRYLQEENAQSFITVKNDTIYIRNTDITEINGKYFIYFNTSTKSDVMCDNEKHKPLLSHQINPEKIFYLTNTKNKIAKIFTKKIIIKSQKIEAIYDCLDRDYFIKINIMDENMIDISKQIGNYVNKVGYIEFIFKNIKLFGFKFI